MNQYGARIWFGKRFDDSPFYFELGSGYRLRGARVPRGGGPKIIYSDEIPYDIEAGFWITKKVAVHVFGDGVVGLGSADTISTVEFNPRTHTVTHLGGGATWRPMRQLRMLAQFRTTMAGINALRTNFIALGFEYTYDSED